MDFDQLMARYDNMVRQLAFYQAENKTLESKLAREKERADNLQKQLKDLAIQGQVKVQTPLIPFDPNRALEFARKWHKEHPDFSRDVFVAFVEMHNYCSIENANWVVDQVLEEYKAAGKKERADKLEKELQDCRSKPGNMAPHYDLAKEVYSTNPMMNKIEMIKEVRYRAGWGLAEAKEAVEKVLAENK